MTALVLSDYGAVAAGRMVAVVAAARAAADATAATAAVAAHLSERLVARGGEAKRYEGQALLHARASSRCCVPYAFWRARSHLLVATRLAPNDSGVFCAAADGRLEVGGRSVRGVRGRCGTAASSPRIVVSGAWGGVGGGGWQRRQRLQGRLLLAAVNGGGVVRGDRGGGPAGGGGAGHRHVTTTERARRWPSPRRGGKGDGRRQLYRRTLWWIPRAPGRARVWVWVGMVIEMAEPDALAKAPVVVAGREVLVSCQCRVTAARKEGCQTSWCSVRRSMLLGSTGHTHEVASKGD